MASFVTVARAADVPDGGGLRVQVGDRSIALFRSDGTYWALEDRCSHAEASLSEGEVEGTAVRCPLHGSRFDLRTGRPLGPPAFKPVRHYEVRVEGEEVQVRL